MKKTLFLILLQVCAFTANAQTTYTQHLQQQAPGSSLGTVNIVEDQSITNLVNNQAQPASTQQPKASTQQQQPKAGSKLTETDRRLAENERKLAENERRLTEQRRQQQATTPDDSETSAPAVDYSKKVLRNAVKIDGFRVQVYSGANSRVDKNKATQIGHQIKSHFPDQPVYVHFKSPHWICRMGNYRTRAEADNYLRQVRTLGYPQAIIVKGKITVAR